MFFMFFILDVRSSTPVRKVVFGLGLATWVSKIT